MKYGLGCLADPHNDKYWDFDALKLTSPQSSVSLREFSSSIHNQGGTGSCVANACVKALEIRERIHLHKDKGIPLSDVQHTDLSRLHLYYLCRELMNPSRVGEDSGTYIWLSCEVLSRFGVCSEKTWPFKTTKVNTSPTWKVMQEAYRNKHPVSSYYRIKSSGASLVSDIITALHNNHPVIFGTTVDSQWMSYSNGQILKPCDPKQIRGRHATTLVGWDAEEGVFIGENSWGNWGDRGFYRMAPETIKHKDSRDFWVIKGYWEK